MFKLLTKNKTTKYKLVKRIVNNCELYKGEYANLLELDYKEVRMIYNSLFVSLIIKNKYKKRHE